MRKDQSVKVKSNSFIITLAILLAACAPTSGSVPSLIPEMQTPTITPIPPTPSANPLAGAPDGATGKNSEGQWIKTVTNETGITVTYQWMEIDPGSGENITGFFASHVLNKIPLWESDDENLSNIDMIPMQVYFSENTPGPFLRHPYGPGTDTLPTLTSEIQTKLGERYYGKTFRQISVDEWFAFGPIMENGITVRFTTPFGNYEWKPSPEVGYEVYVVNWENADPAIDSRFFEGDYFALDKGLLGRSMTASDREGNVIAVIASATPFETLSDAQIRGTLLFPLIRVILNEDQSSEYYINNQRTKSSISNFVDLDGKFVKITHIEIVDTQ